jgi:hypothetical protein
VNLRVPPVTTSVLPALIAASGGRALLPFLEFFAAHIRDHYARRGQDQQAKATNPPAR